MTHPPTGVSIVVICRNEIGYLDGCLTALALAARDAPLPVEVLVIDGRSGDGTAELAERWAARDCHGMTVRVVRCDRAGYGYQRNVGVRAARYPWVAFVSADVRVGPDWLAGLAQATAQPLDLLVGRFDLVTPTGRRPWLASLSATIYPTCTDDPAVERCSTVHLAARRSALLATPFDERLTACEDKALAYRLARRPDWRGAGTLPGRPRHLARETVGQFLAKTWQEARVFGALRRETGGRFPDCFGWGHSAVRMAAASALGGAVGLAVSRRPVAPVIGAAAGLATAARHPVGWTRRRRDRPVTAQALLHRAAMLTICAGYLTGWLADRSP
ncbi:glycosyltransferase family 2 protein [Rugosimonospora africana]|uniref:4,4'-diaponeurosporenoate glycosyltransferase n=1 Tax=Rugosimonospora africana TaxID=556532 RepID=A0A8J3R3X8_9ACTN|nr:glycosyltransferase [Rugosimonospora africana]GIH19641.1 hypothetical protein Raf01_78130 [Rugosimonospora africana]